MSAFASNYDIDNATFDVVSPRPGDIRVGPAAEPRVGALYFQKDDICWTPDRRTTIWVVIEVTTGKIKIQPNAGGANRARWQRSIRNVPLTVFKEEYKYWDQQRQCPPR